MLPDTSQIPDELALRTQTSLENSCGRLTEACPDDICYRVEKLVLNEVKDNLILLVKNLSQRRRVHFMRCDQPEYFEFDGSIYCAEITEERNAEGFTLLIRIRSSNKQRSRGRTRWEKSKFQSMGRYTRIRVRTELPFAAIQSSISEMAITILQTGYRWLSEQINRAIDSAQGEISRDAYSYVRQLFDAKVSEWIWLYVVREKEGVYLVDPISRQKAIANASKRILSVPESPAELIKKFSLTSIAADHTFSREAMFVNLPIEREFAKAKYLASGVAVAECAVYQDEKMVIHPLVRGKNWVTAGYPVWLRPYVEKRLERARPDFQRIVEGHTRRLHQLMLRMKRGIKQHSPRVLVYVSYEFIKHWLEHPPGSP